MAVGAPVLDGGSKIRAVVQHPENSGTTILAIIITLEIQTFPRAASTLQMPDPWDEMYKNVKQ